MDEVRSAEFEEALETNRFEAIVSGEDAIATARPATDGGVSAERLRRWAEEPVSWPIELSIVIPAYNESRRIVSTIAAIAAYAAEHHDRWELIVSDDGSRDGTPDLVERLGLVNCRVLRAERNQGKGAAVRRGLRAARGELILFSDADLSTPIEALGDLLDCVAVGADVAIGSRALAGRPAERSMMRHTLSAGLRIYQNILVPTGVKDTQCGFKLFRHDAAKKIMTQCHVLGFAFDIDMLYAAHRLGYTIDERPVEWVDAPGSTVRPIKHSLIFAKEMLKIRARWTFSHRQKSAEKSGPNREGGGLHIGIVTTVPPSKVTLSEYGQHLVGALGSRREISKLTVFHDDSVTPTGMSRDYGELDMVPSWGFNRIMNPIRIVRAIRKAKPDAVMFNVQFATFGDKPIPAATGLMSPLLARLCGVPTMLLVHNLMDTVDLEGAGYSQSRSITQLYSFVGRVLTKGLLASGRVAVLVPSYMPILREKYKAENVVLMPHGVFEMGPRDVSYEPPVPTIMTFGKFGTYKRVEPLIEAFQTLKLEMPNLELVIAGSNSPNAVGYLEGVREQFADDESIRFTGYVAEEDVPTVFAQCSVVAFPYTSTTGSSGPLHQAASYGRALVVPRVGDFPSVLKLEGFEAEMFDPNDPAGLVRALRNSLSDPENARRQARNNLVAAASQSMPVLGAWYTMHLAELVGSRLPNRLDSVRSNLKQSLPRFVHSEHAAPIDEATIPTISTHTETRRSA